jgi:hypothetical protein
MFINQKLKQKNDLQKLKKKKVPKVFHSSPILLFIPIIKLFQIKSSLIDITKKLKLKPQQLLAIGLKQPIVLSTTNYYNILVIGLFNPLITLTFVIGYFNRPAHLKSCYLVTTELILKIILPHRLLCIY